MVKKNDIQVNEKSNNEGKEDKTCKDKQLKIETDAKKAIKILVPLSKDRNEK